MTAVLLGVLVGFSALAVDIGLVRVARAQLQSSLDAAALSGAQELNGTIAAFAVAEARTIEYASYNPVLRELVALSGAEIDVGVYNRLDGSFVVYGGGIDPATVNAVRVSHAAPSVAPVLSKVAFGATAFQVEATAVGVRPIAVGPAGSTGCFLPFAIPACHLAGLAAGTNPEPFMFTFSPTPTDSIAWGDPEANPSSDAVRDQFKSECAGGEIAVGDTMYVNEGSHTGALHTLSQILNKQTTVETMPWDASVYGALPARDGVDANVPSQSGVKPANWGNTLQGVVALVDAGDDCGAVAFPGSYDITGFAWAVVYDMNEQGSDKNVRMLLDVTSEHDIWGDIDEDAEGGDNVLVPGDASLGSG
jgi:hypothetical protein